MYDVHDVLQPSFETHYSIANAACHSPLLQTPSSLTSSFQSLSTSQLPSIPLSPLRAFYPGTVARFAFGSSVLASYPLIFLAMRNWFVMKAAKYVPALAGVRRISAVLLTFIALLTTQLKDIGVVGSISGG